MSHDSLKDQPRPPIQQSKGIRLWPYVVPIVAVWTVVLGGSLLWNHQWVTSGLDPQCLLMGHRAWHGMSGWYWLTFDLETEQPLHAQVFLDVGQGLDPALAIDRPGLASGFHQIPIYVPRECRMIRFDPAAVPARLRLANLYLRSLKAAPELPEPFSEEQDVYRKLGGYVSSDFPLQADEGIRLSADSPYRWEVTRPDPKFKLVGAEKRLAGGWYLITLRIKSDTKQDCADFFFNFGKGFSESSCATLPFTSGETVRRLYRLPRMDGLDCGGHRSMDHFSWVHVYRALSCQPDQLCRFGPVRHSCQLLAVLFLNGRHPLFYHRAHSFHDFPFRDRGGYVCHAISKIFRRILRTHYKTQKASKKPRGRMKGWVSFPSPGRWPAHAEISR